MRLRKGGRRATPRNPAWLRTDRGRREAGSWHRGDRAVKDGGSAGLENSLMDKVFPSAGPEQVAKVCMESEDPLSVENLLPECPLGCARSIHAHKHFVHRATRIGPNINGQFGGIRERSFLRCLAVVMAGI
jgi:hypothetical protein